ncbi:transcript variant X3 [Nothobranchius furzeri]|uniref:Transcript variant X3 n=1 Tax=Nothobranchius furzeri TaxID=105023 RepID=A0A9D2XYP6_NOTFU|nr:transcript variant X3 [Nothobranchius furzeri]
MSGQGDLDLNMEVVLSPAGQTAERKSQPDSRRVEEMRVSTDDAEEEEELMTSAHLEASTLPWPGDKDMNLLLGQNEEVSESERDTGISRGSLDLSEEHSQAEGDVRTEAKWRESMPEGERWRDDEIQVQGKDKGDGSLADDEEEEDEEEEGKEWMSEKPSLGFTPRVEIVYPTREDLPEQSRSFREENMLREREMEQDSYARFDPEWEEQDGKLCVLVQGVARLHFTSIKPLYQHQLANKEVMVHWHYVNESLSLFLFYFLQLALMATYISQDLVKLVPLLTIVFVFGRLIYWLCLALNSTIRGLGFGLSFFPILVMLGANLYFVCSSVGQESVFDVAPPTTAPPPRMRWWF